LGAGFILTKRCVYVSTETVGRVELLFNLQVKSLTLSDVKALPSFVPVVIFFFSIGHCARISLRESFG
jgi:hypothetical protein